MVDRAIDNIETQLIGLLHRRRSDRRRSLELGAALWGVFEEMTSAFYQEAMWPGLLSPLGPLGGDEWFWDLARTRGLDSWQIREEAFRRHVRFDHPARRIPALVPEVDAHEAARIIGISHSRVCRAATKEHKIEYRRDPSSRRLYCQLPSVLSYKQRRDNR